MALTMPQPDPIDNFDKWLKRFFFLYLPVLGIVFAGFIRFVLPHIAILAPIVWLLISIGGTIYGFHEANDFLRSRAKWRFVCLLAGSLSMTIWVYALVSREIPANEQDRIQTFAIWSWNISGILWSLVLVHSINQTHYHLINTLLVAWHRHQPVETDDDSRRWAEERLREIDGETRGDPLW